MSFLTVFLLLKMSLLSYNLSSHFMAEGRDKTWINKLSSLLKQLSWSALTAHSGSPSQPPWSHKQSFSMIATTSSEWERDEEWPHSHPDFVFLDFISKNLKHLRPPCLGFALWAMGKTNDSYMN